MKRTVLLAALVCAACAIARADEPMPMTTDTQEYCRHLGGMVEAARRQQASPQDEIDMLTREAARLCATGHVRMGVQRLRRAWMLLKASES